MPEIKVDPTLAPTAVTATTRFPVIDDNNAFQNITAVDLGTYFGATGGNTGGGGGGQTPGTVAPVMPPTATFVVPNNRPNGAIVGWVTPSTVGNPAATYEMTPSSGLTWRRDTGDIIISDATLFHAATAAGTVTVTMAATNSVGTSSTSASFTAMGDYQDLPTAYNTNAVWDFDAMSNPDVVYDPLTNLITNWYDRSPENRNADNARDKMSFVMNGLMGTGKPSLRSSGSTTLTTGMFFQANPIQWGLRICGFNSATTVDRLVIYFDRNYFAPYSSTETNKNRLYLDFPRGELVGKPILLTLVWSTTTIRPFIWGQEYTRDTGLSPIVWRKPTQDEIDAGTAITPYTIPDSYNRPSIPGMAFFLFWANKQDVGALISVGSIGQARNATRSAWNGDICRMVSYLNVTEA